jgi:hypothetical protein
MARVFHACCLVNEGIFFVALHASPVGASSGEAQTDCAHGSFPHITPADKPPPLDASHVHASYAAGGATRSSNNRNISVGAVSGHLSGVGPSGPTHSVTGTFSPLPANSPCGSCAQHQVVAERLPRVSLFDRTTTRMSWQSCGDGRNERHRASGKRRAMAASDISCPFVI